MPNTSIESESPNFTIKSESPNTTVPSFHALVIPSAIPAGQPIGLLLALTYSNEQYIGPKPITSIIND